MACKHGLPPTVCAVCTRTISARPEPGSFKPRPGEKVTIKGRYQSNPRATTFQITRYILPSTVDRSFNRNLEAAALGAIEGRFGHLIERATNYSKLRRYLR
jgi:hypothetical protein